MSALPFFWTTIDKRFDAWCKTRAPREAGPRGFGHMDWWLVQVWVLLLRSYRLLFSPIFSGSCRFEPSCSRYAEEAVQRHGSARGFALIVHRLCRCHPFHVGGYDPVPHRGGNQSGAPAVTRRA